MVPYWIIFLLAAVGCIAINSQPVRARESLQPLVLPTAAFVILGLALFAGLRSPTSDADYLNYLEWFNAAASSVETPETFKKDPVFSGLGIALRTPGGSLVPLMICAALLSFIAKMRLLASREFEGLLGFALLFIVARFFLLHEFTQVRASLGIALASLALVYSVEGRRWKAFVAFLIASQVHLSVVALLPLWLFSDPSPMRWKMVAGALLGIAFAAASYSTGGFEAALAEVAVRLMPYVTGEYETSENTLLSVYFVVKMVTLVFLWTRWSELSRGVRLAVLATSYGAVLTVTFIKIDVLSLRLSELTAIFDCVCFAWVFRYAYQRAPVLATASALLLACAFYGAALGIVNDYEMIRW